MLRVDAQRGHLNFSHVAQPAQSLRSMQAPTGVQPGSTCKEVTGRADSTRPGMEAVTLVLPTNTPCTTGHCPHTMQQSEKSSMGSQHQTRLGAGLPERSGGVASCQSVEPSVAPDVSDATCTIRLVGAKGRDCADASAPAFRGPASCSGDCATSACSPSEIQLTPQERPHVLKRGEMAGPGPQSHCQQPGWVFFYGLQCDAFEGA